MFKKMGCLLFIVFSIITGCAYKSAPSQDFDLTLNKHIEAIKNRDIDKYIETVSRDKNFAIIFPNGAIGVGRDVNIKFHKDFFSNPEWIMTFSEKWRKISANIAIVVFDTTYQNDDSSTKEPGLLTLIFEHHNNQWQLIFDQSTPTE